MFSICVTSPCSQTCARGVVLPRTHLSNLWGGNGRDVIWDMEGNHSAGGTAKQVINVPVQVTPRHHLEMMPGLVSRLGIGHDRDTKGLW